MTLNVPPGSAPGIEGRLAHLVAHEYHHTWLHARFEPPDELRFYNEGFTDYYAYLVPARLGLVSWTSFAAELGAKMAALELNPRCGKLTLPAAGGPVFFTDPAARELLYQEGALLAAWLDRCIRRQDPAHSLDEFMRRFNNDPRWGGEGSTPGLQDWLAALTPFVPAETLAHLGRILDGTERFDPAAELRRSGVAVERSEVEPPPGLGANLDSTTIRDLDPAGVATRLGLRAGDTFLELNGTVPGNAAEVRQAWKAASAGLVRAVLRRDAATLHLDAPIPKLVVYRVAADPWRWHMRTRDSSATRGS